MKIQGHSLKEFPVVIELPVLWGHMDAFQHVNNAMYFRYFESVRIVYGDEVDMYRFLKEEGIGPILASTQCKFLKPLRYPDTIEIGCRTSKLNDSVMEQEYAIFSRHLDRLAATGSAKVVAYDYRKLRRASLPPMLIENILKLEGNLTLSPTESTAKGNKESPPTDG